jgi:hypothetical protein
MVKISEVHQCRSIIKQTAENIILILASMHIFFKRERRTFVEIMQYIYNASSV